MKIRGERFKALNKIDALEKKLMENNRNEFLEWVEVSKFMEKLKEVEDGLIAEELASKVDPGLQINFETFVKEIIDEEFRDKFHSVFDNYLDKQLRQAYNNFLSNKGLMAVIIKLRDNMEILEQDISKKCRADFMKWEKKNVHLSIAEKAKTYNAMKSKIEQISREKINTIANEYINNLPTKTRKEAIESIKVTESLIKTVCNFISERTNEKLSTIVEEYKTVSDIFQKIILNMEKERLK